MIPKDKFGSEYVIEVSDPQIGMVGFLVIDNTALGLGKGGIRMTPDVTAEEVFRLARTMTWKNALAGIPFGGAKAGMRWSPQGNPSSHKASAVGKPLAGKSEGKFSDENLKKQHVQSFARALKRFIPEKYIGGPDVNSGEREMAWFVEAIGDKQAATGKPAEMGGLPHELGSTGFGTAHSARVAAEVFGVDIKGATVAVEGFGNVGTFAFKHLEEMGAKVVAVSDSKGNIHLKDGLDYETALNTKHKEKSVIHYKGAHKLSDDDFWGLPVDIFVTAALTDAINDKNKDLIKAKIVVEGSNIPMSEEIEMELWKKGIKIVPDFVANAGGVISSYAEYAGLSPEEMFKMVEEKIVKSTRTVLEESKKSGKNPREVAMEIAKDIVAKKMEERQSAF